MEDSLNECLNIISRIDETTCLKVGKLDADSWVILSPLPFDFLTNLVKNEDLRSRVSKEIIKELETFVAQLGEYNSELEALLDSVHQLIGKRLEGTGRELALNQGESSKASYTEQVIGLLLLEAATPVANLDLQRSIANILTSSSPLTFSNDEVENLARLSSSPHVHRILSLKRSICERARTLEGSLAGSS